MGILACLSLAQTWPKTVPNAFPFLEDDDSELQTLH